MSIDVELALVLGLFLIGAVVLAIDNLVDAWHRRLTRSYRQRKSVVAGTQSPQTTKKKHSARHQSLEKI